MLDKPSTIRLHSELGRIPLNDRIALKSFLVSLFKREGKQLTSLDIIFCSDQRLLAINQDFLGHNYYTDIITFNLGSNTAIEGEIYISVDRVRENALGLKENFKTELHRVIFHGALHLCGFKDKSPREITVMRQKEAEYLGRYFK